MAVTSCIIVFYDLFSFYRSEPVGEAHQMVPDFVQGFSVVKNIITHPLIEAEKEPEQPVQYSVTPSIIREFTKLQTPQKILSPMPYFNTGSQDSIPNVSDIMGNETLEAALAGGSTKYPLGDTSTLMGFITSTQCSLPQGPTNCMAEELKEGNAGTAIICPRLAVNDGISTCSEGKTGTSRTITQYPHEHCRGRCGHTESCEGEL